MPQAEFYITIKIGKRPWLIRWLGIACIRLAWRLCRPKHVGQMLDSRLANLGLYLIGFPP